ncbi:PREDICTED: class E basic helix-loop-helix protein 41 [Ceratotherium simum simum]|uniref:Class E basic helix-loop-helix protein 41 n=1 Tax=Ceratotherium simum simum TaxID=73337 RepID=A0ABM0HWQ3_CERSS|nr:PREDICTED: class E basic helix-loop-helix protein 41 [Ceratotherium simum simum]
MDEGIPHLQERQLLEHRDFIGLDYSSLYMCKPKRSMKRDDSKDTYKLPHRLIEKKRRDRINECIAQLKDLLPEHLKLTTLGHLEKAVVLELTLKHLKALTALTEQQHQKIIALQNGERSLKSPIQSDLDAFHSGFQTCAKEVLQYLSRFESWTPREPRCVQLINHLHAVAAQFLPTPQLLTQQVPLSKGTGAPSAAAPAGSAAAPCLERAGQKLEPLAHCVPVIQRTQPSAELAAENDTDTDSGYGGEAEARPDREKSKGAGASRLTIKQEPPGEDSPAAAAAAAAAFPCLSSVLSPPPEKAGAAAATLLPHEVAPPGALHPPHPHGRTHLPFAGPREPGNPESSAQEDPSQPGKETP